MDPDNRDATDDEYEDFVERASDWMSEIMKEAYELESEPSLNFESQTSTFTRSEYDPTNPDYNLVAITRSYFIFRGEQPTERSVFEVLSQQDLEPFLRSLWITDGSPNPWIFDNAVGLTLATAL